MRYQKIVVNSLGEYMDSIAELEENQERSMDPPILWFRGQSNARYSLIPSLFRTDTHIENKISKGNYSKLHYAEDIRTQHYIAKNYHLFDKEPSSRVEWLEVMQHHLMKTRVLDWSESSIHSLLFALEAFFKKPDEEERKKNSPCVWVLYPQKLNRSTMETLRGDKDLQRDLIGDIGVNAKDKQEILKQFEKYGNFSGPLGYAETKETAHLDYIFNLSSINDEILRDRARLKQLLCNGGVMNPYYYLLFRVYSDGYTLQARSLPPLCVVHPYHSERIRAQRGVFAVFPFYQEQPEDKLLRALGINPDGMEYNDMVRPCLYQILINNPQKVALEMMKNGMNGSWLYPEKPVVSSEIEEHRIF